MPERDRRSEVFLDVEAGARPASSPARDRRPVPDEPFRMAVLGDFSGRANRGERRSAEELRSIGSIRVDRDSIDAAIARLRPRLRIPTAAPELPTLEVEFRCMDDFHPDTLYAGLPLLEELRELRHLAEDPSRFPGEPGSGAEPEAPLPPAGPGAGSDPRPGGGGLLDQILTEQGPDPVDPGAAGDLHAFIQRVAAPHTVAATSARQAEVLQRIDAAASDQLLELLRHRHFRGLESLWRAVQLLAARLETGESLQIHLVDVTRDEMEDELERAARGGGSGLHRLLAAPAATPGDVPWALLVGCYAFRPGQGALLARIAAVGREAGAPFVSRAAPELVGAASFEGTPDPREWQATEDPAWEALRRSDLAPWVALAAPRFLLRLPYGADSDPPDTVALEEAEMPPRHGDFLWGNPAVFCALLLARSFTRAGWGMRPELTLEEDRLPLHIAEGPDGAVAQPCAEALMTDRAASRLLDLGIIPLASFRDQDRVRVARFQSIADPVAGLRGRWA
ncbi:MAG TPA: type VI secretion system contractile sheath large subunit [Longimicrobiales bacterium]|nr:type VI secretion system contractile sheath large subunit [Longimicrobiales bacterium]